MSLWIRLCSHTYIQIQRVVPLCSCRAGVLSMHHGDGGLPRVQQRCHVYVQEMIQSANSFDRCTIPS